MFRARTRACLWVGVGFALSGETQGRCLLRPLATRTRLSLLVLPVFVLFPCLAAGQDDPLLLLDKVQTNYTELLMHTNYDFELVEVQQDADVRVQERWRIAGSGGKFREEALPAGASESGLKVLTPSSPGRLDLFDGLYEWNFDPDRKEYTKWGGDGPRFARLAPKLAEFQVVRNRAKSARLLRQETLELVSGPVVCQVIETERVPANNGLQYSPITYWIDATRNLVLKMTQSFVNPSRPNSTRLIETISIVKATVGQPLDDSLFQFKPPADAHSTSRF